MLALSIVGGIVNRLTRLFSIAVGLLGGSLIFGCTDELTAPTGPAFAVAPSEPVTVFTTCKPQAYAVASAWIGPQGGILRAGKHYLKVPPGALSTRTRITMESPSSSFNRVVFQPEGLVFNSGASVYLVMSYSNCLVVQEAEQKVAYVNESLTILETPPSVTDPLSSTVHAKLSHFSEYVLLSTYAVVY
jgi:hypothetical protein